MRLSQLILLLVAGLVWAQTLEDILTAESATLSTLNAWLTSEQLVLSILSNAQGVTLLAPSNNALNQLYNSSLLTQLTVDPNFLTAFLSYHVLSGEFFVSNFLNTQAATVPTFLNQRAYSNVTGGQKIQARSNNGTITFISGNGAQSNVEAYDLNYTSGTLHVIDTVLTIPGSLTDTLVADGLTAALGALRRAGIESVLNLASDVTVFVPTNGAFSAVGSLVDAMTVEQLTAVLDYHVVQGKVLYSQLIAGGTALTAQGATVNFRVMNGSLFVNSARVVAADILVANGVVHVLDGVLNPDNTTATPNPTASSQEPAFNGATTTVAGVPFTSEIVTATSTSVATSPGPTFTPQAALPSSGWECARWLDEVDELMLSHTLEIPHN
ncbi:uncharacterized protein THITE_2141256 [Thermothielavioides terrestris NRRL 8126]|uniref:FAS1 domain-containing protein n=1 Tax=Thermothielavioides terrestris (strain ATCC 38088 / NRRL 8126) TaxID=578455 RepID=G2QWS7_THETT|nr:uncharacterized protein THITE_2141256 [Thermothielavioides terrestris NRRL 8126]AEO63091.1 hypothetical protein THITE_2141256 [Thermothielavioides terrestris NRRL 8126]